MTCKFSVDAFSFFIPNYYLQNCGYLVPFLLHRIGNLLAYVAAFLWLVFAGDYALVAERSGRETSFLEFARSKPMCSEVLLIRGLFLYFLVSLYKARFYRILAKVR